MQSGGRSGFNVTISAVDQLSKPIADMGRVLGQFSRQLKDFERSSEGPVGARGGFFQRAEQFATRGARAVGRGLREVGTEARELGRGLSEAFEPFAKLAGIGGGIAAGLGLAGLAETIERTARAGAGIGHTADRIGITAQALQELGGAASLAGVGTDALASGVETLGQKLTSAALGQDSQAMAFFRQFHVAVRNTDGSIRSADSALGEIAEAISKIRNPTVQARAALLAFGDAGREMLPFLREGRRGIAEYREEAQRYGYFLSKEGVEASHEFEKAQARVHLALGGVANRITELVLPAINPMLTAMATWIADNRELLGQGIADAIKGIGTAINEVDWKSIGEDIKQVGDAFRDIYNALKLIDEKTKLLHDIMQWQGLGGIFGLGRGGLVPPGPESPKLIPIPPEQQGGFWERTKRFLGIGGALATPGQPGALPGGAAMPDAAGAPLPGMIGPPASAAGGRLGAAAGPGFVGRATALMRDLISNFGITPVQAASFVGNPGFESAGLQPGIQERGVRVGRGGLGYAQWTGPRRRAFEAYAAARGLSTSSEEANRGFTIYELATTDVGRRTISNLRRTGTLGEGVFSVGQTYERPGGTTPTNLPGFGGRLRYAQQALAGFEAAGRTAADAPADTSGLRRGGALDLEKLKGAGSRDSQTSIDVNFNDAPSGMRSRISDSDGPAKVSLRTQFAFGGI